MSSEFITLGGGCFWCTESVFQSLNGVISVTPGYSGGHVENPSYEQVCQQDTGHVEVIRVEYDPAMISTRQILEVFFGTHDPTSLNRQGGDIGPQYASVVFYHDAEQKQVAEAVMRDAEKILEQPVVTRLEPEAPFWVAEKGHHEYYQNFPDQPYCQAVIAPKLARLRKEFTELLRS
ncbi:MAG TPA: peptide-methionine (S)-S-oxide reductase MsrA [Burkholderiaceae bacterium]|nr:peptide-methionine (S)-S-oxide reductase MsrA [Burkholderiaceae bacterium]